jgi:hypothetical protein
MNRRQQYLTKSERRFFAALYVMACCGLAAATMNLIADVWAR